MRKKTNLNRITALFLSICLVVNCLCCCNRSMIDETTDDLNRFIDIQTIANDISNSIIEQEEETKKYDDHLVEVANENIDFFVYERLFDEYSLLYDTFDATMILPDGTEVYGIGYSDFSCYFESEDGEKGFFPAGFLMDGGDITIPECNDSFGIEITNMSYDDSRYGFVYTYESDPFLEHCVVNGKYVKYGIENGKIVHSECDYSREVCDESLGALYSYDENRYLYDPDVGDYISITGQSLSELMDFDGLETEMNRILDEQNSNFSSVEIEEVAYYAQEAVASYLLSCQEETFLGVDVSLLVEEASKLDPMQCFRITPNGNIVIDIEKTPPEKPSALAKWIVGIGCGIAIAGSIALSAFVPAAASISGAISGAAIDIFLQVVIENNAVENVNWGKVAVSATAGALMAWACPLGASVVTEKVAAKTGSAILSKIAGYGILTFSNSLVSGATGAAFAVIDKKSGKEVFDAFLIGAALGAAGTAVASVASKLGQIGMKALRSWRPQNWFTKLTDGVSGFIGKHQVHLKNTSLEEILAPKSIYEASQAGLKEYHSQMTQNTLAAGKAGGSYNDVKANSVGKYTEVHETPSFSSTGATGSRTEANGPSIKMTVEDHRLTASYGNSMEAREYRAVQKALIEKGDYRGAIQMDIDDLTSKFGDKYAEGIEQMLEYAKQIGWW